MRDWKLRCGVNWQGLLKQKYIKQRLGMCDRFYETVCELYALTVSDTNMVAVWTCELQTTLVLLQAYNLRILCRKRSNSMQLLYKPFLEG